MIVLRNIGNVIPSNLKRVKIALNESKAATIRRLRPLYAVRVTGDR